MTAVEDTVEVMSLLEKMAKFRRTASWAVWPTDPSGELTGDLSFPEEDAIGSLHGRAMIVSLNPATAFAAADSGVAPWSNFHSAASKHNDRFLAAAFLRTHLWGAYMADLHPDVVTPKSADVVRAKAGMIEDAVRSLIDQAVLLDEVREVICVGAATFRAVKRHANLLEREIELPTEQIRRITHYSGSAASKHKNRAEKYRELVHDELALTA